ncbi:MAG: hypothetical protein DWQ44_07125 [Bacteroidetes bacterium]|nr:MAG: hypothetical protein DWQ33_12565 [Bacteroidota bacterium]REJ99788.1 MAG: hypothetical protein DWQ39_12745 [Bacteroidota bacterium]REK34161.1 MAG: hypothetical protein DWQ44_07125 [Bacteroidota bacterium]REK50491.1 MAG: hypothetical protein DWQ48_04035 [Bacteroidota bacterium]
MKEYLNLKEILMKLTDNEKVDLFNSIEYIRRNDFSILIKAIIDNPEIHLSDIRNLYFKNEKINALRTKVKKILHLIDDLLLKHKFFVELPIQYDRTYHLIELKKKLLLAEILFIRGLSLLAVDYIDKIISKANKFEFFDIVAACKKSKLYFLIRRIEGQLIEKLSDEIKEYQLKNTLFEKARSYYYKSVLGSPAYRAKFNTEENLKRILNELEEDFKFTKSFRIFNYALMIDVANTNCHTNPIVYEKKYKKILQLQKNYACLNEPIQISTTLLNLARANIYNYNFAKAIELIRNAKPQLIASPLNKAIVIEQQFLTLYFFGQKYMPYFQKLDSFVWEGILKNLNADKIRYYQACIHFIDGKFTDSLFVLSDLPHLNKHKDDWNVAIRILRVLCLIELDKTDETDLEIESLRKHVERVKRELRVDPRAERIVKCLVSLSQHSYNYKKLLKSHAKHVDALTSAEIDMRWKILSPEMIVFHEWLLAKLDSKPYDHVQVMVKQKKRFDEEFSKAFLPLEQDADTIESL